MSNSSSPWMSTGSLSDEEHFDPEQHDERLPFPEISSVANDGSLEIPPVPLATEEFTDSAEDCCSEPSEKLSLHEERVGPIETTIAQGTGTLSGVSSQSDPSQVRGEDPLESHYQPAITPQKQTAEGQPNESFSVAGNPQVPLPEAIIEGSANSGAEAASPTVKATPVEAAGNTVTSASPVGAELSRAASVKRIWREWREIANDPSPLWTASPVDPSEPYEWHFTVRGPADTAFEGGLYHGRIVLPVNYPMSPPALYFLTISGRFEVQKQVCLSVTNFHPELWQPAWGIRSILEALHAFFPTPAAGAANSLDWSDSTRRRLAQASVKYTCSNCGRRNSDLINIQLQPGETHQSLLPEAMESPAPRHNEQSLPKTAEEIEREEYEKRQPPQQDTVRADENTRLLGVSPDRWGLALIVLFGWLVRLLTVAGLNAIRRRHSFGAYVRLSSQSAGQDGWTSIMFLIAFGLVACVAAYSTISLISFAVRTLSETWFLMDLPIQRIDQQTTVGEFTRLTNAERFEAFEIHPWILRLFGLMEG